MQVELEKADLICLVKGTYPHYDVFDHPLVKGRGQYIGGFKEEWVWANNLNELSEVQLFELFSICKNSWHVQG